MKAYLTPDSPPVDTVCRVLNIPNDPMYLAIVNGALSGLIYAFNFEQFGTATPEEAAETFAKMFDDYLVSECAVTSYIVGEMRMFGMSPPAGWLECDGSLLNVADYPALYAAIGEAYGTTSTGVTFKLPNFVQRSARGRGNEGLGSAVVLGSYGGEYQHTLTENEMPSHQHGILTNPTGSTTTRVGRGTTAGGGTYNSDPAGGGLPHNNLPPYVGVSVAIYTTDIP